MIEAAILGGLIGLGLGSTYLDSISKHSLEGKIELIWKRGNVAIETHENKNKRKLYPTLVKKTWEGKSQVLYYRMPAGMEFDMILSNVFKLNYGLKAEVIPKYLENDPVSDFCLKIHNGKLLDRIDYTNEHTLIKKDGLHIPVGWSRKEILEQIDLSDPESSSVLIAGMPGSGKSTWLRLVLLCLHLTKTEEEVQLYMADMKTGVEFQLFGNTNLIKKRISSPDEADDFFDELLDLAKDRYSILKKSGCTNLNSYNEKNKKKMPFICVPIDELAMLQGKEWESSMLKFKKFSAIARAAGMPILCSSQRPSAEILDGTTKNNLPVTIAFRAKNAQSSRVVLGEKDSRAAYIDKSGRALYQPSALNEVWIQVPEITENQTKAIMAQYQIQQPLTPSLSLVKSL